MRIETKDPAFIRLFEAIEAIAPLLVSIIRDPVDEEATIEKLVAALKKSNWAYSGLKAVCLAQWLLESGRGTSELFRKHNNAGGMKWRPEMQAYADLLVYEAHDGKDLYCKFQSLEMWISGYWAFIQRPVYDGWPQYARNPVGYITHLKKCGYAEDPDYVKKVLALLPEAEKLLGVVSPARPLLPALLDPGHSEQEPGARGAGSEEEDLNRLQSQIIREKCKEHFDFEIYDPAVDDLEAIGRKAKGKRLFISTHHNSHGGKGNPGAEVFVVRGADATTKRLAGQILDRICQATGDTNRGVKEMNFTVIAEAAAVCDGPCILIESYFLNPYGKVEAEKKSAICAGAIAEVLNEWYDSL